MLQDGNVTPNKLASRNVINEMNDFTIIESVFSWMILCLVSMSYSNTMTPRIQATVVKLKPLRLSPRNLSHLE
jgi:hypothetical protein